MFAGVPFYVNDLNVRYVPGHLAALHACSDAELGALAGNSIHTHLAAALTMWGLCSVVPRRACMPLQVFPVGNVNEEEDAEATASGQSAQ